MIYGMARECVVWFWFEFYHLWIFLYDDDNLRVLFHGDVFFCGDDLMITAIYDEKDFSPDESVCVGVLGKLATFTTWRKPYFYVTFLLFHFYMLCLIASLTMTYCLICVFCSSVFVAYSIKICILFTLYSECVYKSPFSYLQNCAEKK